MGFHSFDVFDTLLTRTCLRPSDLFFRVGLRLAGQAGTGFSPELYRTARQEAYRRARTACRPQEECSFSAIFEHFPELADWGIPASAAMAAEVALERTAVRAIATNRERVRRLIAAGEQVLFISDMYLPSEVIRELLNTHIAPCACDQVFVSGDLGVAKGSGRLYAHVLKQLGIAPGELRHLGDHEHVDVRIPRRLGIAAERYVGSLPTRYERLPRPRRRAPLWRSAAGGIARAVRLAVDSDPAGLPYVSGIACAVVAPVLAAFVAWVLKDARHRRIGRLYFVSRDGQVLCRIAAAMRTAEDPECRYLYGSRQAWLLPSVTDVGPDRLAWAWASGLSRTASDILRRLEIDTPEAYSLLGERGFEARKMHRPLADPDLEQFAALLSAPPLAAMILDRARERRGPTQAYLRQEGLLDGSPWALVDVGWGLSCQGALKTLLIDAGLRGDVRGYYLGVARDHLPLDSSGPWHAFATPRGCDPPGRFRADWLLKRATITLVEHLFAAADHPSVTDYRQVGTRIEPRLRTEADDPDRLRLCRTVQASVLRYVAELRADPVLDAGSAAFGEYALDLMRSFCMDPDAADAGALAWLPVNLDHLHDPDDRRALARPLGAGDLWRMLRPSLNAPSGLPTASDCGWLAGCAALSGTPVHWLYRAWYHWGRLLASSGH